jgi:parvulin-like peptidyl-prolyl isomerase
MDTEGSCALANAAIKGDIGGGATDARNASSAEGAVDDPGAAGACPAGLAPNAGGAAPAAASPADGGRVAPAGRLPKAPVGCASFCCGKIGRIEAPAATAMTALVATMAAAGMDRRIRYIASSLAPMPPRSAMVKHVRAFASVEVRRAAIGCLAGVAALGGCGTVTEHPAPPPTAAAPASSGAAASTTRPPLPASVERPPALWDGTAVTWDELRPLLAERAGASVLEELLLERQLDRMLEARTLTLKRELIESEERELVAALSEDAARAQTLLAELRAAQGLGERRWKSLLKRNAALRLLVQDEVKITPEAIDAAIDAATGPRRRCRVMALPDLESCAAARTRLDAGEPFGEVAAAMSTDRSAPRGGLVAPVSRLDPTWPSSFRQTLWALPKGGVSAPVLVDGGYVLVRFEEELPADSAKAPLSRATAEHAVRRGQERILMENLARQLRLAQRNAVIFDEALLDGWNRVKNAAR